MHMRGDTGVVALAYGVIQEVLNIAAAESGLVGCSGACPSGSGSPIATSATIQMSSSSTVPEA
jgi:hypothetical protein